MPPSFAFLKRFLKKKRHASICFVGLDRAGKSTIVYRLRTGRFVDDLSRTLGLNVDDLSVGKLALKTFDLGGQETFRDAIWEPYVAQVGGVVFVIDSMDKKRYPEALKELYRVLNMTTRRIPLLVLLNKVDLINDLLQDSKIVQEDNVRLIPLEDELKQFIGGFLHCLDTDFITYHATNFLVLGTSAKTGEGLHEAFADFFVGQLENYLDLLESELGHEATSKDPLVANLNPQLNDYVPFVHPRLVLLTRGQDILLTAKFDGEDIFDTTLSSGFVETYDNLLVNPVSRPLIGKFGGLQFHLHFHRGLAIVVFAEVEDPFLAVSDLAEDVNQFLISKDCFNIDCDYGQVEQLLEKHLSVKYKSIPPLI